MTQLMYITSALQSCPQSPQWLTYNIYKQVATFARHLPHLESVVHKMQGCLNLAPWHYARPFTLNKDEHKTTESIAVLYWCRYHSLHLLNTALK